MVGSIVSIVAIGPFATAVAYFFDFRGFPAVICAVVFIGNLIVFGCIIWATARNPVDFVCELTETHISCKCAAEFMGDSFSISVCDIDEIREEYRSEGGPTYRLQTIDRKSYWLTSNFGNPVHRLVDELRKLRPDVRYVRT